MSQLLPARTIRYITGRGGSAQSGLSVYLSTLTSDFDALAIDPAFLQKGLEEQISRVRAFADFESGYLIANSYGAYLFLLSLIDRPRLTARVLLLSPVLGRAMDPERMLFSRPPREKTLQRAIRENRLGLPKLLWIVTGKDDEVCNYAMAAEISDSLGAELSVLEGQGHMIEPSIVSQTLTEFLSLRLDHPI